MWVMVDLNLTGKPQVAGEDTVNPQVKAKRHKILENAQRWCSRDRKLRDRDLVKTSETSSKDLRPECSRPRLETWKFVTFIEILIEDLYKSHQHFRVVCLSVFSFFFLPLSASVFLQIRQSEQIEFRKLY